MTRTDEIADGIYRISTLVPGIGPTGFTFNQFLVDAEQPLLCGDLFTHLGDGPAVTDDDLVAAAEQAEDAFRATCLTPSTGSTIRRLAELEPRTLAVMHGSSFAGDCRSALLRLADGYDARLRSAIGG